MREVYEEAAKDRLEEAKGLMILYLLKYTQTYNI